MCTVFSYFTVLLKCIMIKLNTFSGVKMIIFNNVADVLSVNLVYLLELSN